MNIYNFVKVAKTHMTQCTAKSANKAIISSVFIFMDNVDYSKKHCVLAMDYDPYLVVANAEVMC